MLDEYETFLFAIWLSFLFATLKFLTFHVDQLKKKNFFFSLTILFNMLFVCVEIGICFSLHACMCSGILRYSELVSIVARMLSAHCRKIIPKGETAKRRFFSNSVSVLRDSGYVCLVPEQWKKVSKKRLKLCPLGHLGTSVYA